MVAREVVTARRLPMNGANVGSVVMCGAPPQHTPLAHTGWTGPHAPRVMHFLTLLQWPESFLPMRSSVKQTVVPLGRPAPMVTVICRVACGGSGGVRG